tara:strand:- start:390 stop:1232 length:843 start_codon:yes stop_codon:yes gene_type:complete
MQFSFQKSFGYPVLRPGSDDYKSGAFQPTIMPRNVAKGEQEARIDCRFVISVDEIRELIDSKKATFALIVDCRDTFYREIFEINEARTTVYCPSNMLKGRVAFETYVIAKENISDFCCTKIDEFFGAGPHEFTPGMILAQGIPDEKNIHAEKLRNNQSLISFSSDETLKLGEWWFDAMSEFPSVYVSPEQLAWINSAPSSTNPIIENTFLVPIVSEMISLMRNEETAEDVDAYPWSSVILEGLKEIDLDISDHPDNEIRLAQLFLKLPLARQNGLMVGGE